MSPFRTKGKDFETAYSKYADMLYRLAFSYMSHKEDAEDVVQEVFTKYMCGLHFPMDEEQEKAWLVRVTINQCNDALRKRSYRVHASLEEAEGVPTEQKETELEVYELLKLLPQQYKAIIILHYLEGYSVEEVAKMLKISVSAAKMRLKRGREFLKGALEKE